MPRKRFIWQQLFVGSARRAGCKQWQAKLLSLQGKLTSTSLFISISTCTFSSTSEEKWEKKAVPFQTAPNPTHKHTHRRSHPPAVPFSPQPVPERRKHKPLFDLHSLHTHLIAVLFWGPPTEKQSEATAVEGQSPDIPGLLAHLSCPRCMKDLLNHHVIPREEGPTTWLRSLVV